MTSRSHIWPRLVHSAVDQETSRIRWLGRVPTNWFAIIINTYHVTDRKQPEVPPKRVRPKGVRMLGVADGDVTRHALSVPFASCPGLVI